MSSGASPRTVRTVPAARSDRAGRLAVSTLCITLALFAAGCPVTPPQQINKEWAETLQKRHETYRFKPGDLISVEFEDVEPGSSLNQIDLVVLPDGTVDLHRLDNHKIEGQTIAEFQEYFEAQVREQLGEKKARIKITPAEEFVYMSGQWERRPAPERLVLTTKMTLQEAVSAMNWMRITADTDYALLWRPFKDPLHPNVYRVDLNDWSEDIYLLPKDQIHLQRTWLAACVNYLREYIFGIFPLTGLTTAIIASGI